MTIRFEKPAGTNAGGYGFTASGNLWKITIPKGEWRDVVLAADWPDIESGNDLVAVSNNENTTPRLPPTKGSTVWQTTYGIFGKAIGFSNLDAKRKTSNPDPNAW